MTLHLVTGGIGSGKSRVTRGLGDHGRVTADADVFARLVLEEEARDGVAKRFPTTVQDDGTIDRAKLGGIVFSDEQSLLDLEGLTHPHIRRRILEEAKDDLVLEASDPSPDLVESATEVIVVDAPLHLRRQWLIGRGMAEADIDRRLANQKTRSEWLAWATMVIPNTTTLQDLDRRIALVHHWLP